MAPLNQAAEKLFEFSVFHLCAGFSEKEDVLPAEQSETCLTAWSSQRFREAWFLLIPRIRAVCRHWAD